MPKTPGAQPTVFQMNLRRLIGAESVNSWAMRHGLQQTTIQRLIDGQDARLSMIERVAQATGIPAWALLTENLPEDAEKNPPRWATLPPDPDLLAVLDAYSKMATSERKIVDAVVQATRSSAEPGGVSQFGDLEDSPKKNTG